MSDRERVEKHSSAPSDFFLKWGFVVIVLLVLVWMSTPTILKSRRSADVTNVLSNAKQVSILLTDFDHDFGEFPSDQTAEKKEALNDYVGEYSNDYLGQLIAGGYIDSEELFYAKWGSGSENKPDNVYTTKEQTLAEGECGFAYIKGLSSKSKPGTPVLLAAMYGDGYKFNPYAYKGKAMVLRADGSAFSFRLNKNGHAKLPQGRTLFESGVDSVWGEGGFDEENLCYAKYPYTPKYRFDRDFSAAKYKKTAFFSILGIYVLFCLVRLFRKLAKAKKKG